VSLSSSGFVDLPMRTNELARFVASVSVARPRPMRTNALARPSLEKSSLILSPSVSTGDVFFPMRMNELVRRGLTLTLTLTPSLGLTLTLTSWYAE